MAYTQLRLQFITHPDHIITNNIKVLQIGYNL